MTSRTKRIPVKSIKEINALIPESTPKIQWMAPIVCMSKWPAMAPKSL